MGFFETTAQRVTGAGESPAHGVRIRLCLLADVAAGKPAEIVKFDQILRALRQLANASFEGLDAGGLDAGFILTFHRQLAQVFSQLANRIFLIAGRRAPMALGHHARHRGQQGPNVLLQIPTIRLLHVFQEHLLDDVIDQIRPWRSALRDRAHKIMLSEKGAGGSGVGIIHGAGDGIYNPPQNAEPDRKNHGFSKIVKKHQKVCPDFRHGAGLIYSPPVITLRPFQTAHLKFSSKQTPMRVPKSILTSLIALMALSSAHAATTFNFGTMLTDFNASTATTGWGGNNFSVDPIRNTFDNTNAIRFRHDGTRVLFGTSDGTELVAGDYDFSFQYGHYSGSTVDFTLTVYAVDSGGVETSLYTETLTPAAANTGYNESFSFSISEGAAVIGQDLRIHFDGGGFLFGSSSSGSTWFDNFSGTFTPIPESSVALLSAAGLFLLLRRRRC